MMNNLGKIRKTVHSHFLSKLPESKDNKESKESIKTVNTEASNWERQYGIEMCPKFTDQRINIMKKSIWQSNKNQAFNGIKIDFLYRKC